MILIDSKDMSLRNTFIPSGAIGAMPHPMSRTAPRARFRNGAIFLRRRR
jgi:hypothetical protein